MKLKRLAALLLCAAVMLPLAACAKKPDSGTSRTSQTTDDTTVTPTKDGDTSITATDKDNKGAAAQDLMQGITKGKGASKKPDSRFANVAASFALDLFKDEYKSGKNTLVSPLSVLTALAMTQNGAEGKTLSEMQKVLGGLDRDTRRSRGQGQRTQMRQFHMGRQQARCQEGVSPEKCGFLFRSGV